MPRGVGRPGSQGLGGLCGLCLCGYMLEAAWRCSGGRMHEENSRPLKPQSTPEDRDLGCLGRAMKCAF